MTKSPAAGPVPESERIVALDVLRGFALFGVFLVNAPFMALTTPSVRPPVDAGDGTAWTEVASWFLVRTLGENKFVALFSFLFGVGLVLQMQRAEAAARPFAVPFLRRLGVLSLIGALHGCLLWMGDILLPYAALGVVLLLFGRLGACVLFFLGLGLALLAALQSFPFMLGEAFEGPSSAPDMVAAHEEVPTSVGGIMLLIVENDATALGHAERVAYREGPLSLLVTLRTAEYLLWLLFSTLIGFNTRVLAAFFLGAAAMKWGFFRRERSSLHHRLFVWGMALGLPLEGALALARYAFETGAFRPGPVLDTLQPVTSLVLSAGYMGGVLLFVQSGAARWLARGLAGIGRMSLTNYLAQSIVANVVFCYFGLALFDELSRLHIGLFVCGVFAAQMGLSALWLRAFRMGPCEWLWRSLSYGKLQPLLRPQR